MDFRAKFYQLPEQPSYMYIIQYGYNTNYQLKLTD